MIRHMVLFRFATHASNEQQSLVLSGLADLPKLFPAMKRFGVGVNISQRDQTFSHVMTIEFETRGELEEYLNSHEHENFVATTFKPNIERRAIASYEFQ
jgi:hypothetical protein